MRRAIGVGFLLLVSCGSGDDEPEIPTTCNGSEALCARAFDEVAYATTHNAMSNADEGWVNPNQTHGITRQLTDGVRGLMLDVHLDDDFEPALCHTLCALGTTKLVDGLGEIEAFLADNRGEVVTIIFESYVAAEETAAAFEASGLIDYVRVQQQGAPWPTLRELIDADERLVVFTDSGGGAAVDWYLDVWDFNWETHFSARTPDEFSCDINRGSMDNELFIFNHFLTQTTPGPDLAEMVNHNPLLSDRVDECMTASGRLPNFVTVDFYDIGDLFAVVDALNGV